MPMITAINLSADSWKKLEETGRTYYDHYVRTTQDWSATTESYCGVTIRVLTKGVALERLVKVDSIEEIPSFRSDGKENSFKTMRWHLHSADDRYPIQPYGRKVAIEAAKKKRLERSKNNG